MPFFGLIIIAQILCAVHVVRTGRQYFWIFVIIFVPMLGMIIYLLAEVLPDLMNSPRAHKAAAGVGRALDPTRAVREGERRLAMTPSAANKAGLAEAYLAAGRTDEAMALFRDALSGIHATDPAMMQGLARAHFALGEFSDVQAVLERLRDANPDYASMDAHLLYARALDEQGKVNEALHEYEFLAPLYPGQEARYRYAMLLRRSGREVEARQILQDICQAAALAPRYVRRAQHEWFALARRQLTE